MVEGRISHTCHPYPGVTRSQALWSGQVQPRRQGSSPHLVPVELQFHFERHRWLVFLRLSGIPGKNGWKDETPTWWGRMFTPGTMGWQYWAFDLPYTNSFIRRGSTPGDQGSHPHRCSDSRCITPGEADRMWTDQQPNQKTWTAKLAFQKTRLSFMLQTALGYGHRLHHGVLSAATGHKLKTWGLEGQERVSVAGTKRRLAARKTVWKES